MSLCYLAHRYPDPLNGTKTPTNLRMEMIEPNDTPSTLHYIHNKENRDLLSIGGPTAKKKNDSVLLQEALEPHYIHQVGGKNCRQYRIVIRNCYLITA